MWVGACVRALRKRKGWHCGIAPVHIDMRLLSLPSFLVIAFSRKCIVYIFQLFLRIWFLEEARSPRHMSP